MHFFQKYCKFRQMIKFLLKLLYSIADRFCLSAYSTFHATSVSKHFDWDDITIGLLRPHCAPFH